MDELGKWEIFLILTYMIMQVVGWICLVIDTVGSLIACKKCVRRKNCEFLIFSEHCPKWDFMSEEEREELREKIKELN